MPESPVSRGPALVRGPKNRVDPRQPFAFLVEDEHSPAGRPEPVATVFLTNRECPFRCVYCDLWKNTTDERVPIGAVPSQIDYALARLPAAQHIKLYNSGNFFDPQAIPPEDYAEIARRVASFQTVIVENHPRLCGRACVEFRDLLRRSVGDSSRRDSPPELEVAMGLETIHPDVLPRLNKQMTLDDFRAAATSLTGQGIHVRAFILLQPPFLDPRESVLWALRSVEFAFDCGARAATVIPTRAGDDAMVQLVDAGLFRPPTLTQLSAVLDEALTWRRGRVFVDLWDAERFYDCAACGPAQVGRLREMNLRQTIAPSVECRHAAAGATARQSFRP